MGLSAAQIRANPGDTADYIRRLISENAKLVEALKAVEFGFNHTRCAACCGWDGKSENDKVHSKNCIVDAALRDHR